MPTFKQLERSHEARVKSVGSKTSKAMQRRAKELMVVINAAYPQVKGVQTGMGCTNFCGKGYRDFKIPAIYTDGSEGTLDARDLWEWASWGKKTYNPKGITENVSKALKELAELCEWVCNAPGVDNISVFLK